MFIVQKNICLIIVPQNPASINCVSNYKRQNERNPYSNTRSTEFRQHPNFSLSNQNKNQYAKTSNGQNIHAQQLGFHQQNQK